MPPHHPSSPYHSKPSWRIGRRRARAPSAGLLVWVRSGWYGHASLARPRCAAAGALGGERRRSAAVDNDPSCDGDAPERDAPERDAPHGQGMPPELGDAPAGMPPTVRGCPPS